MPRGGALALCGVRVGFVLVRREVARASLVSVLVLSLIWAWNGYIVALTLTFRDSITIPLFMGMQVSQTGYTEWWNMSAISLVSVIPVVTAGMALEKYITSGLTFGALKG